MTDIEALRARAREAAAARSRPRDLPLYAAVDAIKAFNDAATIDAVLALDAEITRLRDDLDRVTRERDEARRLLKIEGEAHNLTLDERDKAQAALAKRDERAAIRKEAFEEAANVVEPKGPRPCDCDRCYCDKSQDAEQVAAWDEAMANATAIRARGET